MLLSFTFFPVEIITHLPFPYCWTVGFSFINSHFPFDTSYPFLQILLPWIIVSWNEVKFLIFIYFKKTWKSHSACYFCTKLPIIFVGRKNNNNTFANQTCKKFIWSVRLGVRTPGFHPGNRGSIPLRTT